MGPGLEVPSDLGQEVLANAGRADAGQDSQVTVEVKLPENPATKGFKYGIDPSTGELWFNQLINNKGEF